MSLDELTRKLSRALAAPLPGSGAHRLMAPTPRPGWIPDRLGKEARPASVLVLLYPREREVHLVLTLRTHSVEMHRGQVSFPGGVIEKGETAEEAALREAQEEVGIPPEKVRVLGRLSALHVPATGFNVIPIVAVTEHPPELRPSVGEVACCLEASLVELLKPDAVRTEKRTEARRWMDIPHFPVQGQKVWGATAMILAELLTLCGWEGPSSSAPA